MQNLTKEQAIEKLNQGHKIAHNTFVEGEYVRLNAKNQVVDENNTVLPEFWKFRYGARWNSGWKTIK